MTASSAEKKGKPCAVCGELAGNALFAPFFVGVGITELSMEPGLIPEIKKVIRNISRKQAAELAQELLVMKKADSIKKAMADFHARLNCETEAQNLP